MNEQYDFSKGKRGAIAPAATGKSRITIRLDDDVLEWFRTQVHAAGGGNYQSLINLALREHVQKSLEPLEQTLRRVLREEFQRRPHTDRGRAKAPKKGDRLRKRLASSKRNRNP